KQISFCSQLSNQAELFVLAHEFGHVIINLYQGEVDELKQGKAFIKEVFSTVRGINETEKEVVSNQWAEEIGADIIALQLCLSPENSSMGRMLRFSSA